MKTLSLRDITYLKGKIVELEIYLQTSMTIEKFNEFVPIAMLIAYRLDELKPDSKLEYYIKSRLSSTTVLNRVKAQQILKKLQSNFKALENNFELENYNKKYNKNCFSVEKLEILKLQLDLVKQKGFYLMYQNKEKVSIQEDILTVAAHVIQELSCVDDLVYQIMKKFKGLEEFKDLDYVTKTEELIIAECYLLLFKTLIDLRYE